MAEADQAPIALLERICRLEGSMDASMIFEEDEPTVRMGQDGFALALTQAKLSRLEVCSIVLLHVFNAVAVQLQHFGREISRSSQPIREAAAVRTFILY